MTIEYSEKEIKKADFVQSLDRGLRVIEAFSEESTSLTISEGAKITGLPRPVVRRILLTLEHLGYASSIDNRFYLSARILSLGYAYLSSQNVWNLITPYLETLTHQTGESSSVSILDGTEIVYVARKSTKKIMSIALNIGSRLPAHATSMGQIILAYSNQSTIEEYFKKVTLRKYTEYTLTDEDALLGRFEEIKKQGWVLSKRQLEDGLISLAVPVFNNQNNIVAAINISISAYTDINEEIISKKYVPLLKATAKEIGKVMSMANQTNSFQNFS